MVYLGLLEKARGVAAGVEAVAICRSRGTRIRFTVIGEGRGRRHFEALAQRLGLRSDDVQFHGFMPYEQALSVVARCDVGLIPHLPSESWNSTIPNKLFDYMAAGLSVLTSDAAPTRRVVEQTGCGLWFRGGDPGHLADQLGALSRERDRGRRGAAGRAAVRERFNWEADSSRLLDAVERIGAGPRMASHPRSPE
jgi:glycosyltransferase involved in cell wall biosynthesis